MLTVEFTVVGIPCLGLNGGPVFQHNEAFSFQIATDDQAETDRYWNAIVSNGGKESACGWCKDKWGISWQITPKVLIDAIATGGDVAKRAFDTMMPMTKIDVAKIEAAVRGKSAMTQSKTPSLLIDARIKELRDWRGEMLARVRKLIHQADPEVVEAWKWRGVPVWEHGGIICTGETYKAVVKLTFAKGASLADPSRLFNSSLDGNVRRAIDIHEGGKLDEQALMALIRAAVALNKSTRAVKRAKAN